MIRIIICCLCVLSFSGFCYAGQNSVAACRLDMDSSTWSYEDTSLADIEQMAIGFKNDKLTVAVVAQNVSNLDTYQVEIHFNPDVLMFENGNENSQNNGRVNLLKINGGSTIGFQAIENKPGVINISNTLIGTNTVQAPEGTGILAILTFKVIDQQATNLTVSNVYFIDSDRNEDFITTITGGSVTN
jgi:hypothetical protein